MCDCCDPTYDSPDPVVVRLEREVEELSGKVGELERERDSYRDALYTARRELDVVRDEVGNLLERLRIKGDQLDAAEDDIDRLNQMLRATGYGQGQIDAYADECEARERAQRERDEAREAARWLLYDDNLYTPTEQLLERWPWLEESL